MVDQSCHARLADFGLLNIVSDTTLTSSTHGGTTQWTSPELLDLDLKDHRRTVHSDCYALGMVIYEVLSERRPFYLWSDNMIIVLKILRGDRPERPEGAEGWWFTDDIWEVLRCCWMPQPGDRPSIKEILQCLERVSGSWTPPSVPLMVRSLTQESSDMIYGEGVGASETLPPSGVAPRQLPVEPGLEEGAGVGSEVRWVCFLYEPRY